MVCLSSRPYHFKLIKGCLPQILFSPFLYTLSQMENWRSDYSSTFPVMYFIKLMAIHKHQNKYLTNDLLVLSDVLVLPETSYLQSRLHCLVDYLIVLNFSNNGKPLILDYHTMNHWGNKNMKILVLRDKEIFFCHSYLPWYC